MKLLSLLFLFAAGSLCSQSATNQFLYETLKSHEGKWLSDDYVGEKEGKKFKSARDCYFSSNNQIFICECWHVDEANKNSAINLVIHSYYNSIKDKILSHAVFSHGGVIENSVYTKISDHYKEGTFDYIFKGNETKWKVKEVTINENEFTEEAFMLKDGEWKVVNKIRYVSVGSDKKSKEDNQSENNPLAFMDAFIGSWVMPDDTSDDFIQQNPQFKDMIGFQFEWGDDKKRIMRFNEGVPKKDPSNRILETFVTYNPHTNQVYFIGFQRLQNFLFEGTFREIPNGFVRLYRTWYPDNIQFYTEYDKAQGYVEWRDTCVLKDKNKLHCKTERKLSNGNWTPFDPKKPEGWTMKKLN